MNSLNRVTKKNPCPICKKEDWCLYGKSVAICMRVSSSHPKNFTDGNVGYMHHLDGFIQKYEKPKPEHRPVSILGEWQSMARRTTRDDIQHLASLLNVKPSALVYTVCARRDRNTFAFPMRDPKWNIIGIRLRTTEGRKFAVTGSHQGLFIPDCPADNAVYLVEGPTDVAAALSIGLYAVGRPSCNGGVLQVVEFIKLNPAIRRAVIVADCDTDRVGPDGRVMNPGISGAVGLMAHITIPSMVITLPFGKDMRAYVAAGGDAAIIENSVRSNVWKMPSL